MLILLGALLAVLAVGFGPAAEGAGAAAMQRPEGCTANTLAANDDGSTGAVALGFQVLFQDKNYSSLYVNNNGNITFDKALATYTPQSIGSQGAKIIAPFWADVDTRPAESAKVTYGQVASYGGHPAFCVEWDGVGYFSNQVDKLNKFELILVSRPDRGAGEFDIVFNYDQIKWETGSASGGTKGFGGSAPRVGFGVQGGGSSELSGSGTNGAFLDGGPAALASHSEKSSTLGRYVFPVLKGQPQGEPGLHGLVSRHNEALVGAPVQACPENVPVSCQMTQTNGQGKYNFPSLPAGLWNVTANPPAGDPVSRPTKVGPVQIKGSAPVVRDIVMSTLTGPPSGFRIDGTGAFGPGVPILDWKESTPISVRGCVNATSAGFQVIVPADSPSGKPQVLHTGVLVGVGDSGEYKGSVPALEPFYGYAQVKVTINCPAPSAPQIGAFDVYIDPSGHILDTKGKGVAGATVTLLRSDSADGPFEKVPDGSAIMSPSNRKNPSISDSAGRFGWDVLTGFYKVTVVKPGCANPRSPTKRAVSTESLPVPPPVTDLKLVLNCDPLTGLKATALRNGSIKVSFVATGAGKVSGSAKVGAAGKKKGKGKKGKASAAKPPKGKGGKGKKGAKPVGYGNGRAKVSGLRRVSFTIKPARKGKALLKQRKSLKLSLAVVFKPSRASAGSVAKKNAKVTVRYYGPKSKQRGKPGKGK